MGNLDVEKTGTSQVSAHLRLKKRKVYLGHFNEKLTQKRSKHPNLVLASVIRTQRKPIGNMLVKKQDLNASKLR